MNPACREAFKKYLDVGGGRFESDRPGFVGGFNAHAEMVEEVLEAASKALSWGMVCVCEKEGDCTKCRLASALAAYRERMGT